MKSLGNSIRRWSRTIHRDLGYFFIGACLVYGVSGFVLSLRSFDVDVANAHQVVEVQLPVGLSPDSAVTAWALHRGALPTARSARADDGRVRLVVPGARLHYSPEDGMVRGEVITPRQGLSYLNRLHYNRKGAWAWMALVFAVGLVVLALTGAVMVRGRRGFMHRGVWFMVAGLALMAFLVLV